MKLFNNFRKPEGKLGELTLNSMNKEHTPVSLWCLKHLDIKDGDIILDVGCGGGINVKRMSEKTNNGKVYGLDYSEKSVEISKKVNRDLINQKKVEIIHGDVQNLEFNDETFDIVTAFETIYFWPNLVNCFIEIKRVLKPGGIFMIGIESNGSDNLLMKIFKSLIDMETYDDYEISNYLKKAEYSEIRCYIRDSKNKQEIIKKLNSNNISETKIHDDFNHKSFSNKFVNWASIIAIK